MDMLNTTCLQRKSVLYNDMEVTNIMSGHGPMTGRCVPADRRGRGGEEKIQVCEVQSWCPVEDDRLVLGKER